MTDSKAQTKLEVSKEAEPEATLRVLVVINERKNLEGAVIYLESKNYNLTFVSKVSEMVEQIQKFRPHIVLLSWNLKGTPVDKVYRVLTHKFNLACLVFAEESATHSLNRLNRSSIPQPIIPPIMGPNLVMRIRSLLAQRQKLTKKISKKELTPGLSWEQVRDPENSKENVWKGTEANQPKKQVYFFRGADRPKFNSQTQEWDLKGSNEVFIQEGNQSSGTTFIDKNMAKNLENEIAAIEKMAPSEDFEIEKSSPPDNKLEIVQSGPNDLEKTSDPREKLKAARRARTKVPYDSILAESLKAALPQCKSLVVREVSEKTEVTHVVMSFIKSPRFCGYLICESQEGPSNKDGMKELIILLRDEMKNRGENLSESLDLLEIEFQKSNFTHWAKDTADFVSIHDKSKMCFAYYSTSALPQVIETDDESMLGISLKKDLVPDTKVPFDIYLQLAENRKFLHYLSQGQVFTQDMFDKFKKFQVLLMFIKKSDKDTFFAYCAKNAIDI